MSTIMDTDIHKNTVGIDLRVDIHGISLNFLNTLQSKITQNSSKDVHQSTTNGNNQSLLHNTTKTRKSSTSQSDVAITASLGCH